MGNHTPDLADAPGSTPFVHDIDGTSADWWLGIRRAVLIDPADTGGRWSLTHETLPEGVGAAPHEHAGSDERFYVLQGEITFVIGHEITTAREGDFVLVPRGVCHAFRVDSQTAVFLNGHTPAGP